MSERSSIVPCTLIPMTSLMLRLERLPSSFPPWCAFGSRWTALRCAHLVRMGAFGGSAEKDPPGPFIQMLWGKGAHYKKRSSFPCISPGTNLSAYSVDEKAFRRFCNYLPSIFLTPNPTTLDHALVSMTFRIDTLTFGGANRCEKWILLLKTNRCRSQRPARASCSGQWASCSS